MPELHNNLGGALEAMGKLEEALAAYNEALHLRPAYPDAHYNRGNVLRKAMRLAESAAAYREALQLRPEHYKAANNLATVLADLCDAGGAIECHPESGGIPPAGPGSP